MALGFSWDHAKAAENRRKHGITFGEAATVFDDPLARVHPDLTHAENEERGIVVGHSSRDRLLLVSFTERGGWIRIISARNATQHERQDYEENI